MPKIDVSLPYIAADDSVGWISVHCEFANIGAHFQERKKEIKCPDARRHIERYQTGNISYASERRHTTAAQVKEESVVVGFSKAKDFVINWVLQHHQRDEVKASNAGVGVVFAVEIRFKAISALAV